MSEWSDIGQKLLIAFEGTTPPPHIISRLQTQALGGFTLFRSLNVASAAQVRELTETLQRATAVAHHLPLLIAADQEGGQLSALGNELTSLPGNMALGAAGSAELAYQVGLLLGRECAALGVNVNYAPCCDVNSNPQNPVIGIRSFGEDARLVAAMTTAVTRGIQDAGVVAVPKHFPGHGDTVVDSHLDVPLVTHDEGRLWDVELRPFQAAIQAGAKMMMSAHVGMPALNQGKALPATLSEPILNGLLRQKMGFEGVIVSDAMDMGAIQQDAGLADDIIAATRAGIDLLLLTADGYKQAVAYEAVERALTHRLITQKNFQTSIERILKLKAWVAQQEQPDLSVVGCAEHLRIAQTVAEKSVTLVRDEAALLPLRLPAEARLALVVPEFERLTPADSSDHEKQTLAQALRRYQPLVDEFVLPPRPSANIIADIRQLVADYDLVIVGTIEASRNEAQAALVNALLVTAVPVIAVALRTPYDLAAYPRAQTYLCTYSIQEPAMKALADALFGRIPYAGKLPTQIPGLYPIGHTVAEAKH